MTGLLANKSKPSLCNSSHAWLITKQYVAEARYWAGTFCSTQRLLSFSELVKCRSSDRIRLQLRKRIQRGGHGHPANAQGRLELECDLLTILEASCRDWNTAYLPTLKPDDSSLLLQIQLSRDGACFGMASVLRVRLSNEYPTKSGFGETPQVMEKPRNRCGCRASVWCARQDSNLQPADP